MKGCDWVIHLANVYSFWEPEGRIYSIVNLDGTRNVWNSRPHFPGEETREDKGDG
jgi:nucleoside-diphosphate-sugar epimerase